MNESDLNEVRDLIAEIETKHETDRQLEGVKNWEYDGRLHGVMVTMRLEGIAPALHPYWSKGQLSGEYGWSNVTQSVVYKIDLPKECYIKHVGLVSRNFNLFLP